MKIYFDPSWQFVAAFALSMSYLTAAVARACAFEMRTDAGSPPAAVE